MATCAGAFGGFSGKKCTTVLRFDSEGLEEIPIDHNAGESERLSVPEREYPPLPKNAYKP